MQTLMMIIVDIVSIPELLSLKKSVENKINRHETCKMMMMKNERAYIKKSKLET